MTDNGAGPVRRRRRKVRGEGSESVTLNVWGWVLSLSPGGVCGGQKRFPSKTFLRSDQTQSHHPCSSLGSLVPATMDTSLREGSER